MSQLRGSAALEKRLREIPNAILEDLRPALVKGAEEVAVNMRALVAVDEGDTRDSIAVTGPNETTPAYAAGGGKRTAEANQAFVTVGSPEVRTAHMLEFGTVNMEAQPFMRPSFRLAKRRIQNRISRAIGKAIRSFGT